VVTVWVCLSPPEKIHNTITKYRIIEENMVGNVKEIPENYDLLTAVMVCLGNPNEENYNGLLKMMDVLLSNRKVPEEKKKVLKEEFDIEMTKIMEEEVYSMSHLLQGVKESGIAIGIEQGIEQGELLKAKDMAYNLARLGVSLDKIAEAAKVSIQTIRQWLDSNDTV
jgi:hypothetical protein